MNNSENPMKKRVLFLCTHNSCRSQMAEALVNRYLGRDFEAFSAGTLPTQPHPLAVRVLAELGIDIAAASAKHIDEFQGQGFDFVITLCDDAAQACPFFPGGGRTAHIGFDDPSTFQGTADEVRQAFRRVRDDIKTQVFAYLTNGSKDD